MYKNITFGLDFDEMPTSNLRNGLLKTSGLELTSYDHVPEICVRALTSKKQPATGRIAIPADPVVLREIAAWFEEAAKKAEVDQCLT